MKDIVFDGECPHCRVRMRIRLEACISVMVHSWPPVSLWAPREGVRDSEDLPEGGRILEDSTAPDGGPLPIDCDYQEDATQDPPLR